MAFSLLREVGGYRIEDEIGRGAFAAVYRAVDPATKRVVAIKVFARASDGATAVERFRREAVAIARAGPHANLVAVHAAGEQAGVPYFVMDLVAGRGLDEALASGGPLDPVQACEIAGKLALALEHLHRAGLVHRDVKPGNILLAEDGEPRLIDLSIALDELRATRLTAPGDLLGTPHSMAPEQLRGRVHELGARTDVYGLGAVLFQMLTGVPPFTAATIGELVATVEKGGPVPPHEWRSEVPVAVSDVVLRALAVAPDDRYASAAELAADLARAEPRAAIRLPPPQGARPAPARSASASPERVAPEVGSTLGVYELTGILGKGGMGTVFRARSRTGGEVAIKCLKAEATPAARERFERERRLQRALDVKDGFVPLLDSGDSPSGPYFVMPVLPGGSLRERLERGPLGIDEALFVARSLAHAVARVHERGIVHRDLKPENVLFTAEGRPLVADLGIAKHWDRGAPGASQSVSISLDGSFRGTAGYMAPEQMEDSKKVGPPADVFALGAMIYECFAGVPAFGAGTVLEVWDRVRVARFEPLQSVRADVPREVADVIARALAADPRRRIQSAGELARLLDAPRTGALARALVPLAVALVAVSVVVLLPRLRSPDLVSPVDPGPPPGPANPPPEAAPIPSLCHGFLRGTHWRLDGVLGRYAFSHSNVVQTAVFSPDGKRVLVGTRDGMLKLWNVERPSEPEEFWTVQAHGTAARAIAFVPPGDVAASAGEDGRIVLVRTSNGALVRELPGPARESYRALAVSPDGSRLLAGGTEKVLRLWELAGGGPRELPRLPAEIEAIAFLPDGLRAVVATRRAAVTVVDVLTGEEGRPLEGHTDSVRALALAGPDELLTGSDDRTLRFWSLATGKSTALEGHAGEVTTISGPINAVAISRDGKRALSGGNDRSVRYWDLATGVALRTWFDHADGVTSVAFSPDGLLALSGSSDTTIQLRELPSGKLVDDRVLSRQVGYVNGVVAAPDGVHVVSGGIDGLPRVWDVRTRAVVRMLGSQSSRISALELAGERFVSAGWDTRILVHDATSATPRVIPGGARNGITALAPSTDGGRALVGTSSGHVELWDLEGGRRLLDLEDHATSSSSVAFLRDGRAVMTHAEGRVNTVNVWDVGNVTSASPASKAIPVTKLVESRDAWRIRGARSGAWVVLATKNETRLWNATTGGRPEVLESYLRAESAAKPDRVVGPLAVADDGAHVARGRERSVHLWDGRTQRLVGEIDLSSSWDTPRALEFSRDGRWLYVGTARGVILRFELLD